MKELNAAGAANSPERAVAFASSAVLIAFLWYAGRRGFDITDEGFYFLAAAHPEDVRVYPGFGYLYASIFSGFGIEAISTIRFLGVAMMSAVGAFAGWKISLAYSEAAGLSRTTIDPVIAACVGLHGCLTFYTWTLMGLGYNYQVGAFALALVACLLCGLRAGTPRARRPFLFAAGACIAAITFVKISSGIGFLLLAFVLLFAWPVSGQGRASRAGSLLYGLAAWAAIHFVVFMSPVEAYQRWMAGFEASMSGVGYGSETLLQYQRDIVEVTVFLLKNYGVAIVLTLLARIAAARHRRLCISLYAVAIAWMVYQGVSGAVWIAGVESCTNCRAVLHFACWIVIAMLAGIPWPLKPGNLRQPEWLICAALLATPVLASIGTSNRLGVVIGMTLAAWIVLLYLLASRFWTRPHLSALTGVLICLLATSQVVSAFAGAPYRLATGIFKQDEPARIGTGGTLLVDEETARFWREMQSAAQKCGLAPGTDILAFYNLPGVVFALKGRAPGVPWFYGGYSGSTDFADFVLARVDRVRLARAWILEAQPATEPLPDLRKVDVDFPDSFELCGSSMWPFDRKTIRLWKPQAAR